MSVAARGRADPRGRRRGRGNSRPRRSRSRRSARRAQPARPASAAAPRSMAAKAGRRQLLVLEQRDLELEYGGCLRVAAGRGERGSVPPALPPSRLGAYRAPPRRLAARLPARRRASSPPDRPVGQPRRGGAPASRVIRRFVSMPILEIPLHQADQRSHRGRGIDALGAEKEDGVLAAPWPPSPSRCSWRRSTGRPRTGPSSIRAWKLLASLVSFTDGRACSPTAWSSTTEPSACCDGRDHLNSRRPQSLRRCAGPRRASSPPKPRSPPSPRPRRSGALQTTTRSLPAVGQHLDRHLAVGLGAAEIDQDRDARLGPGAARSPPRIASTLVPSPPPGSPPHQASGTFVADHLAHHVGRALARPRANATR